MSEDVLSNVVKQIDALNALILENKESSSKVMIYLANKNKELEAKMLANDKTIMAIRNDINDIIEAENHSYNEIETIMAEIAELKELENRQIAKIKELESKFAKHQDENKKTEKSFDVVNKSLFNSIDSLKEEQSKIEEKIKDIETKTNTISDEISEKLIDTKDYILFDRKNNEMSKLRKFFYKIFHYKQFKQLELQKQEEEKIRQQQIQEELEKKKQQEEAQRNQKRNQIKDILNSTKKS